MTFAKSSLENELVFNDATTYDEAITLTGHGKFQHALFLGCTLTLLVLTVECDLMPYLLPAVECDFSATSSEKGLLNAIVYIGMICGCHLWGFFADTTGRRKVLLLTLVLDGLCTVISSIMPSLQSLVAVRFLNGFFISGLSVSAAYLREFHSEKTKMKPLLWMCVAMPVASAMMPGVAWMVIPQTWSFPLPWITFGSWRILILICAVPAFLTALIISCLPESPKLLMVLGRTDEALEVLRKVFVTNTGKPAEEYPVKALLLELMDERGNDVPVKTPGRTMLDVASHMWFSTKQLFSPPYLLCTTVTCVFQFGVFFIYCGFFSWLPDLFNRMAEYHSEFPDKSATFCKAIKELNELYSDNDPMDSVNESTSSESVRTEEMTTLYFLEDSSSVTTPIADVMMNFTLNLTNSSENAARMFYSISESTSNYKALINGTMSEEISSAFDILSMGNSLDLNETECSTGFDTKTIQDILIISTASGVSYILVGFIVKYITKKCILVSTQAVAGACSIALYFTTVPVAITALPGIFIVLSGVGYGVINAFIVNVIPTHLRAMAVGMSLTAGRLGAMSCCVLLGYLIETKCDFMVFLFGGVAIVCGLVSLLLPGEQRR